MLLGGPPTKTEETTSVATASAAVSSWLQPSQIRGYCKEVLRSQNISLPVKPERSHPGCLSRTERLCSSQCYVSKMKHRLSSLCDIAGLSTRVGYANEALASLHGEILCIRDLGPLKRLSLPRILPQPGCDDYECHAFSSGPPTGQVNLKQSTV